MTYLIILTLAGLTIVVLSILFAIEAVDRTLTLIDRVREIVKTASLDTVQIWSSGNMAGLDKDRERARLELSQDYGQVRLDEYRQMARLKILENRLQLKAKSELMK